MDRSVRGYALWLMGTAACIVLPGLPAHAQTTSGVAPHARAARGGLAEEVIVTARRRKEKAQTVPVSITAFSPKVLAQQGIQTTNDLQRLVPGVVFNGAGSITNTTYTIRGQGKAVTGPGLPSVITYFNEVPLPGIGSYTPTFDISNIQVLKGPQGTLFGRNTTGGAVLVYSNEPTYAFGGYAQADLGDYNRHYFQGAVNIPIIKDVLAVRIAGDIERRDGYTHNVTTDSDQDNVDSTSARVSVLFQPVSFIKNVTVYDYLQSNTNGQGFFPFQVFNPALDATVAAQNALGNRTLQTSIVPYDDDVISGVSNTTTVDLNHVTFKNIFGFRYTSVNNEEDDVGLPLSPLPDLGPGVSSLGYVPGEPGNLITTHNVSESSQISEEVQLSGKVLNDKLSWLLGGFYVNEHPDGRNFLILDLFRPIPPTPTTTAIVNGFLGGVWPIGALDDTLYRDESKAVFANVNYDIDQLLPWAKGLRFNAGFRYTWDTEGSCSNARESIALATGLSLAQPYSGTANCDADTGSIYGPASFDSSVDFKAPTYTIGLDYEVSKNIFLYFTTRRGYRAGGLNTPLQAPILSPYQTFQPQTVTDYEIGAHTRWQVGDIQGRFNIDAFTGHFSQLQLPTGGITAGSGIPGVTASNAPSNSSLEVNAGSATAQGVEFDGAIAPFTGLSFTYGAAYLDEHYDQLVAPAILAPFFSASNFTGAPKWTYQGAAQYVLPLNPAIGDVSVQGSYYHIAKEYQVAALLPAYSLVNFNIQWANMFDRKVTLTLYVDNALDTKYIQDVILSTPAFGAFSGNYAAPRMYGGRLRYDF
jgi:iron complex outermembrane receptor protein